MRLADRRTPGVPRRWRWAAATEARAESCPKDTRVRSSERMSDRLRGGESFSSRDSCTARMVVACSTRSPARTGTPGSTRTPKAAAARDLLGEPRPREALPELAERGGNPTTSSGLHTGCPASDGSATGGDSGGAADAMTIAELLSGDGGSPASLSVTVTSARRAAERVCL